MGQKMSATNELSHAMKKLRLTNLMTDDKYDGSVVGVAQVVDVCSPSSPYRKEAGRRRNVLDNAIHAPLEDVSHTISIETPQGVVSMGIVQCKENMNNDSVSPVLNVDIEAPIDYHQGDDARDRSL